MMKTKERLSDFIRGWLPDHKLPIRTKATRSHWRKPNWLTLTVIAVALTGLIYFGVTTSLRYFSPPMDITSAYYEKTTNCSCASVGDIVEINVMVYWHGHVLPEFRRNMKIIDPFEEGIFVLSNSTNVIETEGHGGSYQLKYSLKVASETELFTELSKPRLFIDNIEIALTGENPTIYISK